MEKLLALLRFLIKPRHLERGRHGKDIGPVNKVGLYSALHDKDENKNEIRNLFMILILPLHVFPSLSNV